MARKNEICAYLVRSGSMVGREVHITCRDAYDRTVAEALYEGVIEEASADIVQMSVLMHNGRRCNARSCAEEGCDPSASEEIILTDQRREMGWERLETSLPLQDLLVARLVGSG